MFYIIDKTSGRKGFLKAQIKQMVDVVGDVCRYSRLWSVDCRKRAVKIGDTYADNSRLWPPCPYCQICSSDVGL